MTLNYKGLKSSNRNININRTTVLKSEREAIVSMYRRLNNDTDVSTEVASRLFTSWQLIKMLLEEIDTRSFRADNGVIIRLNMQRVEIEVDERINFGRQRGSTLAAHLSRGLTSDMEPSFERCVKVCEAVDELLNKYTIL